jgi:Rieske Fe-S protein
MTNTSSPNGAVTRRTVLTGAAAIGVTSALVACGDGDDGATGQTGSNTSTNASVPKTDVPVGGGKIVADQKVVVTQPTAGNFKAFSAVCTHQGCVVSKVDATKITCACHNSVFSTTDGSVMSGPASRALEAKTVTVSGDNLTIT